MVQQKSKTEKGVTVSAVICCHGVQRLDWLAEAVDSLLKQKRKPEEIIVVYDLMDGIERALKQRLPSSVKLIPNRYGNGLSLARNTGIKAATSDIVAFLDDDAVAEPEWLTYVISSFDDPKVVGVGGKAIPEWIGPGRPFWFPEEIDWVVGCMHANFQENKRVVRNVFGCNMCFRKDRLTEINGFNYRLGGPISGDDTDICIRIANGDKRHCIVYEPKAIINHKIPHERQSIRYIAYSAWKQGVGKAITQKIHRGNVLALSSEKSYLKSLVFRFLPRQMLQLLKHPRQASGKIIAVVTVIVSISTGFLLTKMNLYKVKMNKIPN